MPPYLISLETLNATLFNLTGDPKYYLTGDPEYHLLETLNTTLTGDPEYHFKLETLNTTLTGDPEYHFNWRPTYLFNSLCGIVLDNW